MSDRQPANTIRELDAHLSYVQRDLGLLAEAVSQMATRSDIARLAEQMAHMATKQELSALEARLQEDSVPSRLNRALSLITRIGAAAAVVAAAIGAFAAAVHYLERMPK